MKKITILSTLLAFFILSCEQPVNSSKNGTLSNVEVLANIPNAKVKLPKSLAATTQSTSRAVGDVTELKKSATNSVKSQGWIELNIDINSNIKKVGLLFLSEIKEFAKETLGEGNDLISGKVYDLGIRNPFDQLPFLYNLLTEEEKKDLTRNLGKIRVERSENFMEIFWKLDWENSEENKKKTMLLYFNISNPGEDDSIVKLYAKNLDESGHWYSESKVKTGETINWSNEYNSEIDNSIMKSKYYYTEAGDLVYFDYDKSIYPDDDSENNDSYEYKDEKIAFGNDNLGGVISLNKYSVNAEYYNGNGELIVEEEGSTKKRSYPITSYDINLKDLLELTSAPDSFKIKKEYNLNEKKIYYQDSSSPDWVELNNELFGFYYYFYYSDSDNSKELVNYGDRKYRCIDQKFFMQEYTEIREYKTSHIVPETSNYFGGNYYLDQKYPLNQLLPLSPEYRDKYVLMQKELNSYTFDMDDDGVIDYSLYNMEFWLENLTDDNGNNLEFNIESDIKLNDLNDEYFFYWDLSSTKRFKTTKSYAYKTGEGLLPDYFNSDNIEQVKKAKLEVENIYNEEYDAFLKMDYSNAFTNDFPSDDKFNGLD